ncbi:MAG: glycine cleavage system protein R [Gammaproteobacteria bacterium]|nr:glycine cleavage system protein R [Gammaproteobacteria bacterium]
MGKYIVITAVGQDRPGIVNDLSKTILDCGGNITESRMTVLGGEFALLMLVGSSDIVIEALENELRALQEKYGLAILFKRTELKAPIASRVPYNITVISMDHPGIVHDVAAYLSARNINIEEMDTSSYSAAHTGTKMFSLQMSISVPSDISIAKLREEFIGFCNDLNLDATMTAV